DPAGVDPAVPDEPDQLGQEAPDGGGTPVEVDGAEEEVGAAEPHAVGDADERDVAAGAGGADGLRHGHLGADGLDGAVRAVAVGQLSAPRGAPRAALRD